MMKDQLQKWLDKHVEVLTYSDKKTNQKISSLYKTYFNGIKK